MKQATVELAACARCDWRYPADILSPLGGALIRQSVCGICAREMRAAIHGVDIPFREGTMAREYELDAINWRKAHPNG